MGGREEGISVQNYPDVSKTAETRTDAMQGAIDLGLTKQLGVLCFHRFELDGHLLARRHVCAEVNVTKRPAADLPTEAVLLAHAKFLRGRGEKAERGGSLGASRLADGPRLFAPHFNVSINPLTMLRGDLRH